MTPTTYSMKSIILRSILIDIWSISLQSPFPAEDTEFSLAVW